MPNEKKRGADKLQKREASETEDEHASEADAKAETSESEFDQFESGTELAMHKHSTLAYLSGAEAGAPSGRLVPFGAITSSLRPSSRSHLEECEYDEFGFLLEASESKCHCAI